MLPQAAEAENGFQEVAEFHSMDFFLLGLNTYSFLAKNVLIVMVPTLINKDVFEPSSLQFSSFTQSCPTLCDAMDCSMPGLPVHHQLPEFTQTYVH